jgi:phosphoribosyl-dephospho-CoA transferase
LLAECAPQLPAGWQPKIGALAASPEIAAASPRVYGSAAIEIVTAEPCLTPTSDLDLLLAPSNWSHAVSVAAALAALDLSLPEPRLDGEIVNPEGVAVAWRELATRRQRVLMKSHARVGLDSTAAFGRGFAACERAA